MNNTPHPDDLAVDAFAAAMKAKMADQRAKGYQGWEDPEQCPASRLRHMLVMHIAKGDPVDVGNFAMMLFMRGERTMREPQPCEDATAQLALARIEEQQAKRDRRLAAEQRRDVDRRNAGAA
jgi:hypothetical protein